MDAVQHRVFLLWKQSRVHSCKKLIWDARLGRECRMAKVASVAELLVQDIRLMTIARAKLDP